jgi:hypothetical protein
MTDVGKRQRRGICERWSETETRCTGKGGGERDGEAKTRTRIRPHLLLCDDRRETRQELSVQRQQLPLELSHLLGQTGQLELRLDLRHHASTFAVAGGGCVGGGVALAEERHGDGEGEAALGPVGGGLLQNLAALRFLKDG